MMFTAFVFYLFAAVALAGALFVVLQRNPVYSALALILTLFAVSGLFFLLNTPFIGILQILVYAGAIMVLYLFVIMLLNLSREESILRAHRLQRVVGTLLGGLLLVVVAAVAIRQAGPGAPGSVPGAAPGTAEAVGRALFSDFLFPFEMASILLLAAIVGAIVMAKEDLR
ncbi:MAG: NADH-quinone oxidoreductase subunit J [Deltaproteobacteria bacterium]|nr:NADH-quinone oxidoreductase subunit J [Deltaproteobacteria bacterium]